MRRKNIILIGFIFISKLIFCQQNDVLTLNDFIDVVKSNHPAIAQAGLDVDISKNELLSAKGGFDPIISYTNEQKTLDNKNYFQYQNAEIYVPIGMGIEVYGGVEKNNGDRINTEYTPNNSTYAGLSIPLARDIIIDKRRAALRQSKKMLNLSLEEQRLNVLNIIQEAEVLYYEWVASYLQQMLIGKIINLNIERLDAISIAISAGERASVDSIEMLSQLNTFRQIQFSENQRFKNISLELSTFLWDNNSNPIMLKATTLPDTNAFTNKVVDLNASLLDLPTIIKGHPKVLMTNFKIDMMNIEQKLKQQSLLPKADLKYNFINTGLSLPVSDATSLFNNNYKFGLDFSMPIPNRKAVGELRAQKSKVQWALQDLSMIKIELDAKLKSSLVNIEALKSQIEMIQSVLKYNQTLLEAELIKLSQGESSIFLINVRENKVVESNQKLIQLKTKLSQEYVKFRTLSGEL